jgi:hypothetical protein
VLSDKRRIVNNITGAEVELLARLAISPHTLETRTCVVVDPIEKRVRVPSNFQVAGVYRCQFRVTFAPGTAEQAVLSFPNGEYEDLEVRADLD